MEKYKGVYIPNIDGKDLYISQTYLNKKLCGYSLKDTKDRRKHNTSKFDSAIDDSLDLRKLREVYKGKYKGKNYSFSFEKDNQQFSKQIVNVTFNYNVKEFNHIENGLYVRYGYSVKEIKIDKATQVCIKNNLLCAIQTFNEPRQSEKESKEAFDKRYTKELERCRVKSLVDNKYLKKTYTTKKGREKSKILFYYENNVYKAIENKIDNIADTRNVREFIYKNGFKCDDITYIRWGRTAASARNGSVLFINNKLYDAMHEWNLCGLNVQQDDEIDLASFEAYKSLTMSSIIDTVEILPNNILIMRDAKYEQSDSTIFKTSYNDNTRTLHTEKDKMYSLNKERIDEYKEYANELYKAGKIQDENDKDIEGLFSVSLISNSIWDGQSLLDKSVFGERYKKYGMLLLRNRFFKSACFNTNLEEWFSDNGITEIHQLDGYTLAKDISEIKLITTESSIKYLKFSTNIIVENKKESETLNDYFRRFAEARAKGIQEGKLPEKEMLQKWLQNIDSTFGIVKHDKPTHYFDGRMVRTHYQLLNTLELNKEELRELINPSFEYMKQLKDDPRVLRQHINTNQSDFFKQKEVKLTSDIFFRLLGINEQFTKTKLYNEFVRDSVIKPFKEQLYEGRILIKGNYSVLFGNPMSMLRHAIKKASSEVEFEPETLHSINFDDGEEVLCCRSPHTSMGNLYIAKNKRQEYIDKYFNLSNEIVCVDSMRHNLLERLSGADFDSDTVLITNHKLLVTTAKKHYEKFLVPVNLVSTDKVYRKYNTKDLADLDSTTAGSQRRIGEIINVAQALNSRYWETREDKILTDLATLSVMSGLEIDSAKRENPADNKMELDRIKSKYADGGGSGKFSYPNFMKKTGKIKNTGRYYEKFNTTMELLDDVIKSYGNITAKNKSQQLPFHNILISPEKLNESSKQIQYNQADKIIKIVKKSRAAQKQIWNNENLDNEIKYKKIEIYRQNCIDKIAKKRINKVTMGYLLTLIEKSEYSNIRIPLFNILFSASISFFELINENNSSIPALEICKKGDSGDIYLYDIAYKVVENSKASIPELIDIT